MTTRRLHPALIAGLTTTFMAAAHGRALADEPTVQASPPAPTRDAPADPQPSPEPSPAPDPAVEESRVHPACEIGKSYESLSNIGQVYFQLGPFAKARRAFEQYLRDGGEAIDATRRAQVDKDLETLRTRTATLEIRTRARGRSPRSSPTTSSPRCSGQFSGCSGSSCPPRSCTSSSCPSGRSRSRTRSASGSR